MPKPDQDYQSLRGHANSSVWSREDTDTLRYSKSPSTFLTPIPSRQFTVFVTPERFPATFPSLGTLWRLSDCVQASHTVPEDEEFTNLVRSHAQWHVMKYAEESRRAAGYNQAYEQYDDAHTDWRSYLSLQAQSDETKRVKEDKVLKTYWSLVSASMTVDEDVVNRLNASSWEVIAAVQQEYLRANALGPPCPFQVTFVNDDTAPPYLPEPNSAYETELHRIFDSTRQSRCDTSC